MGEPAARLVVFADDWGRHPSSCQHLIRELLPNVPALWINTVGTRRLRLSVDEATRAAQVAAGWIAAGSKREAQPTLKPPRGLTVLRPLMYPGFRTRWQRAINARLIAREVNQWLKLHPARGTTIAVTTLPITADLIGKLKVDRWSYYCVDDFSAWPGLDGGVMRAMEAEQVGKVDAIIAAGENLAQRVGAMHPKAEPAVLTHGVDLWHWQCRDGDPNSCELPTRAPALKDIDSPIFLFWGLIDRRLDVAVCRALAEAAGSRGGRLVLVGPQQDPDPALSQIEHLVMLPKEDYSKLPRYVLAADVLVMPYRDIEVTRAMQPLKLKEYLATNRPAVVRDLPGTREWADAADLATTPQQFAQAAIRRLQIPFCPADQRSARQRLEAESWSEKAKVFIKLISGQPI